MCRCIDLSYIAEKREFLANLTETFQILAKLKAPQYLTDERKTRAPVIIVAVLDRSGSMNGIKLALVKKTIAFVVQNLKAEDHLGIVSYDNSVKVELPVLAMTPEGQKRAVEAVQKIEVGGSTNLSGGLFTGIKQVEDILTELTSAAKAKIEEVSNDLSTAATATAAAAAACERPEMQEGVKQAMVASVWLFTDGLANAGIQDVGRLKQETETRLARISSVCSLFTFGFGSDHNSSMLQAISKVGNGMYYYIETEDTIPSAFSDCLGGLLSVAAQNLHLTASLVTPGSAQIVKVHTAFRTEVHGDTATVHLPDLYSEEARDIIFDLQVNSTDTPCLEPAPFLTFTLQYFNVITCAPEEVSCVCEVRRPAEESQLGEPKPVPVELDMQRNRVKCMEALAEAHRLSEEGNLSEARQVLRAAIDVLSSSVSNSIEFCKVLLSDLKECLAKLQTRKSYASVGAHTMASCMESHGYQRSSHRSMFYSTPIKAAMTGLLSKK